VIQKKDSQDILTMKSEKNKSENTLIKLKSIKLYKFVLQCEKKSVFVNTENKSNYIFGN
jgi:hypothetical protein